MNKSYGCIDGKVILEDKEGKKYAQPMCNNTYDIVRQENLIETIDDNIENIELEKKNTKVDKNYYIFTKYLFIFLALIPVISTIICLVIFPSSTSLLVNDIPIVNLSSLITTNILKFFHLTSINEHLYHGLSAIILPLMVVTPTGIIGAIASHISYKKEQKKVSKKISGYEKSLEYLKTRKLIEEETLEKLKAESKELTIAEQEKDFKHIDVDDTYNDELNEEIDKAYSEGFSLNRKRRKTHE